MNTQYRLESKLNLNSQLWLNQTYDVIGRILKCWPRLLSPWRILCIIPRAVKTKDLTLRVKWPWVGLTQLHGTFKNRKVSPGVEWRSQRHVLQLAGKNTNTHVEDCRYRWETWRSQDRPHITADSRKATSVLKRQGHKFCQQSEWDWKLIYSQMLKREKQHCWHLGFHLVRPWTKEALSRCAGLPPTDMRVNQNRCCLKLLSLWVSVMQQ